MARWNSAAMSKRADDKKGGFAVIEAPQTTSKPAGTIELAMKSKGLRTRLGSIRADPLGSCTVHASRGVPRTSRN
jgi:hypothetical protein